MRMSIRAGQFRRLLVWFLMTLAATASAQTNASVASEMPKSHNPFSAYSPEEVPEPQLTNSPLLGQLIVGGKLHLSLKDAVRLALENNLDLAIARYNLPIANTDILRTKAGGVFRGVNAGVVQGTPGGGVGGFGAGAPGGGAGGTTGGAGGAGAGASGLVQSTLGVGTPVASYDPAITASVGAEHQTSLRPVCRFTACLRSSSIPDKPMSVIRRLLRPAPAFQYSSTTTAKPTTVLFSTCLPSSLQRTSFPSSSNCLQDLASAPIFATSESQIITKGFLTSPSKIK